MRPFNINVIYLSEKLSKGVFPVLPIINVIFSSLNVHARQSFARATFQFVILFQPILLSFLLYMMLRGSNPVHAGEYIVVSSGLMNLWSSIIFSSAGDIDRERYMGTLECIYVSPSDFRLIFLGHVLGNLLLGLFSMILSSICVVFLFGLQVHIENPIEFLCAFTLSILSFTAISLLIGLIFTLSRSARILMNCLEYPIYILCGLVFPISVLPKALQFIAYVLSPTWAAQLLRESMAGIQNIRIFYFDLIALSILILVYFLLTIVLFKKIDRRVRIDGTLGVH